MRIGICSYWFNRGQGVVSRHVRSALEALGHETFVLARPSRPGSVRPAFVDHSDVWDQPDITEASAYAIPEREYLEWAAKHGLEACFFDQNYEFEQTAALRRSGVSTIGRFVWETFAPRHVEPARRAFDLVYSLTDCERERYARLGVESPRVHWGIHPEWLDPRLRAGRGGGGRVTCLFPGGYLTKRKPFMRTLEAFSRTSDPRLRLLIKGQVHGRAGRQGSKVRKLTRASRHDPRIELILEDLPMAAHMGVLASADVCLAPSRWEGLGLHLYEAIAFGAPVITNDNPPMNEVVRDGVNGLLVRGARNGEARSGIPAFDPDVEELTGAIERLAEPALREELARGATKARDRLSWERTVRDYAELLELVG